MGKKRKNGNSNIKLIQHELDNRRMAEDRYDDTVVRQMVECVKVFPDGRLEVYFGGGYLIEECL